MSTDPRRNSQVPGDPGAGRDRDETGRARNARPRDELGRPLPYGTPGVEPIPEDLLLDPDATLDLAQDLLDRGLPFQAHEVLEAMWKRSQPHERDLWQGLAQVGVGITHARRGNHAGGAKLLRRAGRHLRPFAGRQPYGVQVDAVREAIGSAASALEAGSAADLTIRLRAQS